MRVARVDLIHLSLRAPLLVASSGVSEISIGDSGQTARSVKIRREFAGDALIVDKTVRACRSDGLFIEAFGFKRPAFNARDLRMDQRGTVFKIWRAMLCPHFELPGVICQGVEMALFFLGRCRIPVCGVSEGSIKAEISRFQLPRRSPIQLIRLKRGVRSRHNVSSKEPRLQFARPVEELGSRQNRIAGQVVLLFQFVEFSLGKASERRSQPAEGANKTELRLANTHYQTEPRILRKLKTIFGLRLDLGEGVSHYQIVCD